MASRVARRLGWLSLVTVLLLGAALVGVNVYLNSEYLPRLIQSEQQWVHVEYRLAWSVWPGRIHFQGLRVRGDEHAISWELTSEHALVKADLTALTSRKVHVEELALTGVNARVRPRLHYLDATEAYLKSLPSVPSDGPPFLSEGPELPDDLRRERDAWSIQIDRAIVKRLETLWVDRFRFNGHADAEGSVKVSEGRVLQTGPTTLQIQKGSIFIEDAPTVRELEGTATSTLGPIDLMTGRGFGLLGAVSGDAELRGVIVALDFLPRVPGLPMPIEFDDAVGPAHTKVSVKDGVVQPGATLTWEAPNANATIEGFRAKGALTLNTTVELIDGAPRTRAVATMKDWSVARDGQPVFSSGESVVLTMDAPNVSLAQAGAFDVLLAEALAAWPGRVQIERARVASQERGFQWEARIDAMDSALDLSALTRRELSFRDARVKGVEARLRPRLTADEAIPQVLRNLPIIQGMPEPPLRESSQPKSFSARAAQNPWSLSARDAVVEDLREIWLDAYRFQGKASATGGFTYEAGGKLSTPALRVKVAEGALNIARWRAVSELQGDIEAQLGALDLGEADGYAYFRPFTARAVLSGQLNEVDFIRHYPSVPLPAELSGGEGPIRAEVAVREGLVQAGSVVQWETRSVQATTNGFRFVGPFSLNAKWSDIQGEPRVRVDGRVSPYRVTRVGEEKAWVSGRLITMRMDAPKFDLARPNFEPMTYAEVVDGKVPDLRVLNLFVPEKIPLKMDAGAGTFTGKVAFSHRGHASAELEVGGVQAELIYDKTRFKGDWSCRAKLGNVDLRTGAADIVSASVLLNNMAMREGAHLRDGWFGRIDMKKGKVRPGEAILLSGDIDTTMRDGRPMVAFFVSELDLLPAWARNLVTLQALRATAHVRIGKERVEVDGLNARGQSIEMRGRLRKDGDRQWGDMLVLSRGQEVGVAVRGTRVEFKLMGAANWYRSQMRDHKW